MVCRSLGIVQTPKCSGICVNAHRSQFEYRLIKSMPAMKSVSSNIIFTIHVLINQIACIRIFFGRSVWEKIHYFHDHPRLVKLCASLYENAPTRIAFWVLSVFGTGMCHHETWDSACECVCIELDIWYRFMLPFSCFIYAYDLVINILTNVA